MNLILITLLSPLKGWKVKNNTFLENTTPDTLKFLRSLGFNGRIYVLIYNIK